LSLVDGMSGMVRALSHIRDTYNILSDTYNILEFG
jgi:hypothetical protein